MVILEKPITDTRRFDSPAFVSTREVSVQQFSAQWWPRSDERSRYGRRSGVDVIAPDVFGMMIRLNWPAAALSPTGENEAKKPAEEASLQKPAPKPQKTSRAERYRKPRIVPIT